MARVFILLCIILFSVYITEQAYFLQEEFIEEINKEATTWKAGVNFDPIMPKENILKLLGSKGVQIPNHANSHMYKTHDVAYDKFSGRIPKKFDARKNWKMCETIGATRDQGNCGSCWAVATSSAFADRLCIATDGEFNQLLSIEELAFCCHMCGSGCDGGYPINAWKYFKRHGIVTGGDYNTIDGCQPYGVPPCPFDKETGQNTCADQPFERNHKCPRRCYGDTDIDYYSDHHKTRDYYYLTYAAIQKDVLTYGPIEATFLVYDDFINYKYGVYVKSKNATSLGGHAVKLIGWGEEFGVPYWLMMNSWGEEWGDSGTFRIRRGTNECGIDNSTTGGVPVVY